MIPTRYLVDTNILLRFLTGTPADQAAASRKLFQQAAVGEVVLDVAPVTVAEAHYTLISFYGIDRKLASEKLGLLLRQRGVDLREENQVLGALARLQTNNVGFADAYLAAGAAEANVAIASFDRDFDRMKVPRYEPKP
jgi:predicted nucleic acid-binding protein